MALSSIIRIGALLIPILANESLLGQDAPIPNDKNYNPVAMGIAPESQYHHCFESPHNGKEAIRRLPTTARDWLTEDAVYIITPEERCAFLQLETDEERNLFIEQFWNRRTLHPISLDYDFKVEHYRRIVYANEKYGGQRPGWKTDRGRIYVLFGPPDSVDVKEGSGNTKIQFHPLETWHYHYIRGLGENVQFDFNYLAAYGDYRLPEEENDMLGRADPNPDSFPVAPEQLQLYVPDGRFSQVRSKDLEAIVTSQVVRGQVKFSHRIEFCPATKATTLVRIEIQIPCETCTRAGQIAPSLAYPVFIRVFEQSGRVVSTSELAADIAVADKSDSNFSVEPHQDVPLAPGMYQLAIVTRNPVTSEAGVVRTRLDVPTYEALKTKN
jgi:GWxTD domain-containing protein